MMQIPLPFRTKCPACKRKRGKTAREWRRVCGYECEHCGERWLEGDPEVLGAWPTAVRWMRRTP